MASTKFGTPITYMTPARLRRMARYMVIANDLSLTQAQLVTALNAQTMTHPRFDFDSFDKLCDEALAEDKAMMEEGVGIEEAEHWAEHDSLGATVVQLARLPDPPEAA